MDTSLYLSASQFRWIKSNCLRVNAPNFERTYVKSKLNPFPIWVIFYLNTATIRSRGRRCPTIFARVFWNFTFSLPSANFSSFCALPAFVQLISHAITLSSPDMPCSISTRAPESLYSFILGHGSNCIRFGSFSFGSCDTYLSYSVPKALENLWISTIMCDKSFLSINVAPFRPYLWTHSNKFAHFNLFSYCCFVNR